MAVYRRYEASKCVRENLKNGAFMDELILSKKVYSSFFRFQSKVVRGRLGGVFRKLGKEV